jgi:hypothetical protein
LRQLSDTTSDLHIKAGFIDFKKKFSFSLFLLNYLILANCLNKSVISKSTGLKSPLSPLASICARYFPSFESKLNASFGLSVKFLINANINNYNRLEASFKSFLGLISEILIYVSF